MANAAAPDAGRDASSSSESTKALGRGYDDDDNDDDDDDDVAGALVLALAFTAEEVANAVGASVGLMGVVKPCAD